MKVGKAKRSAWSLISLGAAMKVKYVDAADAADAAGEDVLRWFELCETPGECTELANDMKGLIDSVAATRAEWLSRPDAPRSDPTRVRPTEDALGLDAVPFRVGRDQHDPIYTFDCSWCCGVDLLRAAGRRAVGRTELPFRDFPRRFKTEVDATVYELDEETLDGLNLHGHIAVADYHGGWIVWLGEDLKCEAH